MEDCEGHRILQPMRRCVTCVLNCCATALRPCQPPHCLPFACHVWCGCSAPTQSVEDIHLEGGTVLGTCETGECDVMAVVKMLGESTCPAEGVTGGQGLAGGYWGCTRRMSAMGSAAVCGKDVRS